MEAEEAERVVRTVHKAAARAVDRLVSEMNAPAWKTMGVDAKRAALIDILDEYNASVESDLAACDEMLSFDYDHPYLNAGSLALGLGALREMRSTPKYGDKFHLLDQAKGILGRAIARIDQPQRDDGGPIGSRPPGPGFYESEQARAEAVAGEQRNVTARPGLDSARADSVPEAAGPYDDLREPWYRRLLGRNRAGGSPG
jgi:hypothetical protein